VLIDTLAALFVTILAVGLVFASVPRGTTTPRLAAIAREIETQVVMARNNAIAGGHDNEVLIDGKNRAITSGNQILNLPSGIFLAVLSADGCRQTGAVTGIIFQQDGGSCGATIRLTNGHRSFDVRVNSLTGAIGIASS